MIRPFTLKKLRYANSGLEFVLRRSGRDSYVFLRPDGRWGCMIKIPSKIHVGDQELYWVPVPYERLVKWQDLGEF